MSKNTTKPETKQQTKFTTEALYRIFSGLKQLAGCEIEDFNTNLKITKNMQLLQPVSETYDKAMHALREKHLVKDDKGNFLIQKNQYVFKSITNQADWEKEITKLNKEEVEVSLYSFKASIIKDATGLKAAFLHNCYEIIEWDVEIA